MSEENTSQSMPRVDYAALRATAEKKLIQRLRGLHHLLQVSKGAGNPTLTELNELFTSLFTLYGTFQDELRSLSQTFTTMLVQTSLRQDAFQAILKDKGIIESDEELQGYLEKVVEEQKAKVADARKKSLEASIAQAEKTKSKS